MSSTNLDKRPRTGRVVGTAGAPMFPTPVDHWAASLVHPTGGEPFGTKVTFWSLDWGTQRAVITHAPSVEDITSQLSAGWSQWQIVIESGGMTHAGAEQLTFGWHPDTGGR